MPDDHGLELRSTTRRSAANVRSPSVMHRMPSNESCGRAELQAVQQKVSWLTREVDRLYDVCLFRLFKEC